MADDFKVGDTVVRVRDPGGVMPVGTYCKVLSVRWWPGCSRVGPCVALDLDRGNPISGRKGWVAENFRKLPPADPAFIELMRGLKAPKRVKEDA